MNNVVPLPTQPGNKVSALIPEKDSARLLAKEKADAGWCVDLTGNFPLLLHAPSDRVATPQSIRLEFPSWAVARNLRVDTKSYPTFLSTLPDRVMALLPQVYGKGMRPCAGRFITDKTGIQLVNTYNPAVMGEPLPLPLPFDEMGELLGQQVPKIVADLFKRVFPVEAECKFIVQRLAAIIQNPSKRVKHAVFLVGEGGTGKSTVLDVLEKAMGGRHIDRSASYTEAHDKFSETYCNNVVVAFEDKAIGTGGESYVYTNMKQVIDYNSRTVQIKHSQRSVQREVYCNIFITSNNPGLFPWDENERRFFAPQKIAHLVSAEESGEFLSRFHAFLQLPQAPAVLHNWLANLDISDFDYGRCPRTPFMQELIAQSGTMLDHTIDDFLDELDIFHPVTLADYLKARKQTHKPNELKVALEIRGWEYKRMTFRTDGFPDGRFNVWRKRPGAGRHFRDLTPDEHREMLIAQGTAY